MSVTAQECPPLKLSQVNPILASNFRQTHFYCVPTEPLALTPEILGLAGLVSSLITTMEHQCSCTLTVRVPVKAISLNVFKSHYAVTAPKERPYWTNQAMTCRWANPRDGHLRACLIRSRHNPHPEGLLMLKGFDLGFR